MGFLIGLFLLGSGTALAEPAGDGVGLSQPESYLGSPGGEGLSEDLGEAEDEELEEDEDLFDLDLDDLRQVNVGADPVFEAESLNAEVSSVDGTKSTVGQSAAAVYVLTGEMIERSGVRTIPDALRLVPGVQVAHLNSHSFSVSIRGFAGQFANKVLVQIDGRGVYSHSFGGVFWDIQDTVLADIDRIEVIRGPGATIWGENAVNGVINIITKRADDTVGNYVTAGGGDYENAFSSMSIGRRSGDLAYRIYTKYADRGPGFNTDPLQADPFFGFLTGDVNDGGHFARGGVRFDYTPTDEDRLTLTLDHYQQETFPILAEEYLFYEDPSLLRDGEASGGFALLNWNHIYDEDRDLNIRGYYDRTNRSWIGSIEKQDTFEIDVRHRHRLSGRRERVVGLTGRYSKGRFFGQEYEVDFFAFPAEVTIVDSFAQFDRLDTSYFGGFFQEKWTLVEDKLFTWIGAKIGDNNFNGVNVQPSVRSLLVIDDKSVVWGSISRALRLPTRFDAGVQLQSPDEVGTVDRTPDDLLINEEVIAYEMGLRRQPNDWFSWELALFYNDYQSLVEEGPISSIFGGLDLNRSDGESWGAELNGSVQLDPSWSLSTGFSYIDISIDPDPDEFLYTHLRQFYTPEHMLYLQSLLQVTPNLQWDATLRYNDQLPDAGFDEFFIVNPAIPSYFQLDTRINYRLTDRLDFTLVARNLLDQDQQEFHTDDIFFRQTRTNARRNVYAHLTWKTGRVPKKRPEATKPATTSRQQPAEQAMNRLGVYR